MIRIKVFGVNGITASHVSQRYLGKRSTLELLETIQNALLSRNYIVTTHFIDEMQDDYLFFVDVKTAVMESERVNDEGVDDEGNPKVEIVGPAADGRTIGVICSVRPDGSILLMTVYEAS